MDLSQFSDYRSALQKLLKRKNPSARGQKEKLAKALGVASSQLSQILSGSRDLTPEQACRAAEFFVLTPLETEYFLGLVQLDRASSNALKTILQNQIDRMRKSLEAEKEKAGPGAEGFVFNEADKGVFYSQWYYSAIRLLSSIPGMNEAEKISRRLGLPIKQVQEAIEFCLRVGLLQRQEGTLRLGPSKTFTQRGSPYHGRHHLNWRVKALEFLPKEQANGLSYTAAVTISRKDAAVIKEIISNALEKTEAMIEASPSESLYCLNLDWFEL